MTLRMTSTRAARVNLEVLPIEAGTPDKENVSLSFRAVYNSFSSNSFAVIFSIVVEVPGEFKLDVEYWVDFELSEDITEELRDSQIFMINAPAIGFPFLRSFVNLIAINSGYSNIWLPSVNFVELYNQNQAKTLMEKE